MRQWLGIVAALAVATSACGAKTELIVNRLVPDGGFQTPDVGGSDASFVDGDGAPQGAMVRAVCQCGLCAGRTFCVGSTGEFTRWGNCMAGERPSQPVQAILSNGATQTIYCDGHPSNACEHTTERITTQASNEVRSYPSPVVPRATYVRPEEYTDRTSPCYLSRTEITARRSENMSTGTIAQYCQPGAGAPSEGACNTVMARTTGTSTLRRERAPGAEELTCQKQLLLPNQEFCILGPNTWGPQLYRERAREAMGAYCAMLGPSENWGHVGPGGVAAPQRLEATATHQIQVGQPAPSPLMFQIPVPICFARADCTDPATVRPGACVPLENNRLDPGDSPSGQRYATQSTSVSSWVKVSSASSPGLFLELPVDAQVSVDNDQHPTAVLTNLEVQQRAPQTWGGTTVSDTLVRIEDLWSATYNAATGRYNVDPSTGKIQVRASIAGQVRWNRYVTASSPTPTIKISGSSLQIDARFVDTPNDLIFDVHLELIAPTSRPSSSIEPLSPLDPECTDPTGADVTLRGHATSGAAGVPARVRWLYQHGNIPDADTVTLRAPVRLPSEIGEPAQFASIRGVHSALSELSLRSLDRVAPTILRTRIQPPCGWGTSAVEPNPQVPQACARVDGVFTDTCSLEQSIEVLRIAAYDYPSGAELSNVTYGNGEDRCIHPIAGRLDANLSNVDYEIDYRVRDRSGNRTQARRWRGWFLDVGSDGTCSTVISQVTLSDVHI